MSALRALGARVWAPAFVLALLAGVLSMLLQSEQPLVQTHSSHGGVPFAWGAAYDLLQELGLHPSRTRARLAERDLRSAQWIIQPAWSEREAPHEAADIAAYARRGGRVLLIGAPASVWRALGFAPSLADLPAPATARLEQSTRAGKTGGAQAAAPEAKPDRAPAIEGVLLGRKRHVELAARELFAVSPPAGTRLLARAPGGALVLERQLGEGKIVALAASEFLTNERLAHEDNALFLLDLARAYGPPSFDERCHGLLPERSLWSALGPGFLLLAGLAWGALGAAALAHARRWPARADAGAALPAPTLEVFVSSLASLYRARGRGDPRAVFRAYRAGFLRRLQRRLFGQREVSQAQFEARIEREAQQRGPRGRWLLADAQVSSRAELLQAAGALERLAAEMSLGRKR